AVVAELRVYRFWTGDGLFAELLRILEKHDATRLAPRRAHGAWSQRCVAVQFRQPFFRPVPGAGKTLAAISARVIFASPGQRFCFSVLVPHIHPTSAADVTMNVKPRLPDDGTV